jgi:hypothetical protein
MTRNGNSAPIPYRKGWRAPWRRGWGGFWDGHCKVAKLAKRIEAELRATFTVEGALAARLARMSARYAALAEMTIQSIGRDPKASRRAATALQAASDRQLARLEKIAAVRRPLDLARAIAEAQARTPYPGAKNVSSSIPDSAGDLSDAGGDVPS